MRRKQTTPEINYLEQIFNNNDFESPEEKAIWHVETVPSAELTDSVGRKKYEKV